MPTCDVFIFFVLYLCLVFVLYFVTFCYCAQMFAVHATTSNKGAVGLYWFSWAGTATVNL